MGGTYMKYTISDNRGYRSVTTKTALARRSPRGDGADSAGRQSPRMEGEHLDTLERMVVSPAAGIFAVVHDLVETIVAAGATIGFVHAGDDAVPVRSPFEGRL